MMTDNTTNLNGCKDSQLKIIVWKVKSGSSPAKGT
jgi:hypothetical protein